MAKIERFEDIKAWQLSRELVKKIYALSKEPKFSKDFGFKDQITRAAVSVMSNIAEGFERYTKSEFIQFLVIAKGSVGEVRSQVYVAYDSGYIVEQDFLKLKGDCEIISRCLWNLIKYLKGNQKAESFSN